MQPKRPVSPTICPIPLLQWQPRQQRHQMRMSGNLTLAACHLTCWKLLWATFRPRSSYGSVWLAGPWQQRQSQPSKHYAGLAGGASLAGLAAWMPPGACTPGGCCTGELFHDGHPDGYPEADSSQLGCFCICQVPSEMARLHSGISTELMRPVLLNHVWCMGPRQHACRACGRFGEFHARQTAAPKASSVYSAAHRAALGFTVNTRAPFGAVTFLVCRGCTHVDWCWPRLHSKPHAPLGMSGCKV